MKSHLLLSLIIIIAFGVLLSGVGLYHFKKDSANGRLLVWHITTEMVKEKPLCGYGPSGFKANNMLCQAVFFESHPNHSGISLADNVEYPYNEFLGITVKYDAFGLLIVLLIGYFILLPQKSDSIFRRAAQYACLSVIIFGLFSYPSGVLVLKLCFVMFVAIIAIPSNQTKTHNSII